MFDINEILKTTKGKLLVGSAISRVRSVSIDSRTVRKGALFIAIKGKRHDGHAFVRDALEEGARGAVVASKYKLPPQVKRLAGGSNCSIVAVTDTLKALGDIARFHRNRFDIPVVAITGSNGKTTTKEMLGRMLMNRWSPLKNYGTQNNLIGVPLTLLKLSDRNKSALIELGMNRAGEIKILAGMVRPNIGVITNIGPSHLEYLDNLDAVYRAKRELLDFLERGDMAVLNNDDAFLRRFKKRGLKIVTFGINVKSDFQAKDFRREGMGWRFLVNGKLYYVPLPAYHDIYNALSAISVGRLFDVNPEEIKGALSNYVPLQRRMVRSTFKGIGFIDDTYNSNPLSLESAIRTLAACRTRGKKILVSGDMLELGSKAVYYHNRIGKLVARSAINNFIGVGELARNSFLAAKRNGMEGAWFCPSKKEAATLLKRIARPDDVVLVKGSRAMRMEEVIRCFITSFTR